MSRVSMRFLLVIAGCCVFLVLMPDVAAADDYSLGGAIAIETRIQSYKDLRERAQGSSKPLAADEAVGVGPVAMNGDGSVVAISTGDFGKQAKIVLFWTNSKKSLTLSLPDGEDLVEAMAFTRTPNILLTLTNRSRDVSIGAPPPTAQKSSVLRHWDIGSGKVVNEIRTSDFATNLAATSPAGNYLAYALRSSDGLIGDTIRIVAMKDLSSVGTITCHPDTAKDLGPGLRAFESPVGLRGLRFDSSGNRLLVVGKEHLWVFDVVKRREILRVEIPKGGQRWLCWLTDDDKLHQTQCVPTDQGLNLAYYRAMALNADLARTMAEWEKRSDEEPMAMNPTSFVVSRDGSRYMMNSLTVSVKGGHARALVFREGNDYMPSVGLAFSADSRKVLYRVGPYFVLEDIETEKRPLVWYCADVVGKRKRIGPPETGR